MLISVGLTAVCYEKKLTTNLFEIIFFQWNHRYGIVDIVTEVT